MTEVLRSPSSSSSSSTSTLPPPTTTHNNFQFVNEEEGISGNNGGDDDGISEQVKDKEKGDREQLSLLAILLTLFRKSFWVACKAEEEGRNNNNRQEQQISGMEISWPTNVRHVAHVTFDRFNGFLGLPVEFETDVPRRAPSASATVFGVSTESMQLSYDIRGNSIPTILLLMQRRLYSQGGLQAEGIFRINAENSQEEHVRNQLNRGVVPDDIDVHCLAGLIKAWFRELPSGVLDPLSPEQVMQCQGEDDCSALVRLLPPTESALLDWAINLMVDVVQQEHVNKMNAHNIAMVFAPNMTQMADPLTALMYAVQVMNFLKTLITKALREREESVIEQAPISHLEPSDENGHQGPSHPCLGDFIGEQAEEREREQTFTARDPPVYSDSDCNQTGNITDEEEYVDYSTTTEDSDGGSGDTPTQAHYARNGMEANLVTSVPRNWVEENKLGQSSDPNQYKGVVSIGKIDGPQQLLVQAMEKSKGISNLSRINSLTERVEAWR